MSEWQPIETAPLDQWILLFDPDDVPHLVVGIQAEEGMFEQPSRRLIWSPTHWMPLPDPPEKR